VTKQTLPYQGISTET